MKNKLIVITGPTGVGKTKYSIEIAKRFDGEIISCDSFQIYKYLDIGTAKIKEEEKQGVVHHNLDFVYPDENYNIQLFQERTKNIIKDIIDRNKLPILVGGTGLYIHSILHNIEFSGGKSNPEVRSQIESEIEENGLDYVYEKLINIDSEISKTLDKNNRQRVIRAYEIYINTGESPVKHLNNFRNLESQYDYLYFILNDNRDKLYDKINNRVDQMIKDGLLNEINSLLSKGYTFDLNSFKAIGYKEFKDYFENRESLDNVIEKIKQHSRNYAKRQLTWFRRVENANWINKSNYNNDEEVVQYINSKIEEFLDN